MTDQPPASEPNSSRKDLPRADGEEGLSVTSFRIREAQEGNLEALSPVIEKMSPLLLAFARSRLATSDWTEAEDVVQDAWGVAMARLGDLRADDGRLGAVLFRFMTTTITRRVNDHLRRAIRRVIKHDSNGLGVPGPGADPGTPRSEAAKAAMRSEACRSILSRLETYDVLDQEPFFSRGMERLPYALIAKQLGAAPNTLAKRYQRLRDELRLELDSAVLDEFLN